jgi:peptidoglycan/xylan/chitin deacetylase (PgdA/CDA1 family)
MKTGSRILLGFLLFLLASSRLGASNLPANQARPNGCASAAFDVRIEAERRWGVAPFRSDFSVETVGEQDSVEAVYWSFGDGLPPLAMGATAHHRFTSPVDYQITASVVTTRHGVITRRTMVSGYRAVMTLTFDDGVKSTLTDALPLLASYGVVGTAYVVPAWTTFYPDYYLGWDEMASLEDAGWEIGCHSMTHPDLTELEPADLFYEIVESRDVLLSHGLTVTGFSLPHEAYNDTVLSVVESNYESCKTDKGLNPGIDDTDPYMIRSYTSQSWYPFDYYKAHIDSVIETGGWYVLNNHILVDDCNGQQWCVPAARIAQVIEYAQANRVKIATIREVVHNRNPGYSDGEDQIAAALPDPPAVRVVSVTSPVANSACDIRYYVSKSGPVGISIYDVMGRRVMGLMNAFNSAGEHTISWDGGNSSGNRVAGGYYFVVFTSGGNVQASSKIVVLR